jgi:hypothetical protein
VAALCSVGLRALEASEFAARLKALEHAVREDAA